MLDLSPEPREIALRPPREKKGQLGMAEMLRGALANQVQQLGRLVAALPEAIGAISQVAAQTAGGAASNTVEAMLARLRGQPAARKGVSNLGLAPRTRLNVTVSDTRAFAGVSLPLAELNAARRRHHASLNDAVLMICSGALRRLFTKHGPLPRKSMVAAVPISLRAKGDTASNNQASMSLISLGTHIADPANPGNPPAEVAYPAAGTPNADVSLAVVDLAGRRTPVEWDRARLARTGGTPEQYKHPCLISDPKFRETVGVEEEVQVA